jgi:hypothetical protein
VPREAESAESGESNFVLPYRKSGRSGGAAHVVDQRSQIAARAATKRRMRRAFASLAGAHG